MCMFETMPYPDYSDHSYIHAIAGLRCKSGNYQFLNQILDEPEDTNVIQQSLVTVFSALFLFGMFGQIKNTLGAICAASQVAYHFGKI